jgi:hypothetical protein
MRIDELMAAIERTVLEKRGISRHVYGKSVDLSGPKEERPSEGLEGDENTWANRYRYRFRRFKPISV